MQRRSIRTAVVGFTRAPYLTPSIGNESLTETRLDNFLSSYLMHSFEQICTTVKKSLGGELLGIANYAPAIWGMPPFSEMTIRKSGILGCSVL
jgi:hypothetical protein